MKTYLKLMMASVLSVALLIGCDTKSPEINDEALVETALMDAEESVSDASLIPPSTSTIIPGEISEIDVENILYMLEEEKLANNVYVFLNEKYNRRVFLNISKSEVIHQKAVMWLVDLFKIEAPAPKPAGEFYNEGLQKMYTQLTTNSATLVDAYKAGALIEEHDIQDLKRVIAETENENVKRVFSNLMRGSTYHLRAFVANLKFNKVVYEPQVLTQEEFDAIILFNQSPTNVFVPGTVTQADINNIIYMYEEEKLANNTYLYFNQKFQLKVFENIAKSEVAHQQSVLRLAVLYNINLPTPKPTGEFSIAELQDLYTALTTNGKTSIDALKAGAYIEEHDIKDLKRVIAESENENVKRVFSNLLRGSTYHLRAFVANLKFNKVVYEPQVLTQEEYNAIITN